ncbi:hypothetical protein [Amycolatopsis sp. NPDC051371]|uniref:hypothetical protein n=1 Tax=Amycolatopsis sp. NPDC051371 TaxID=3155800 RepID=UPI0034426AAF
MDVVEADLEDRPRRSELALKASERAHQQRLAALTEDLTEELTTAGVTISDQSLPAHDGDARSLDRLRPNPEDEPRTELSAEDHASCPGHGAWIETDHHDEQGNQIPVAVYGCADFLAHGHALSYAPAGRADFTPVPTSTGTSDDDESSDDEQAAEQADEVAVARAAQAAAELERRKAAIIRKWVIQNNKDWDASATPRRQWLAALVQRSTAPKGARMLLPLPHGRRTKLTEELLGYDVDVSWWVTPDAYEKVYRALKQ